MLLLFLIRVAELPPIAGVYLESLSDVFVFHFVLI